MHIFTKTLSVALLLLVISGSTLARQVMVAPLYETDCTVDADNNGSLTNLDSALDQLEDNTTLVLSEGCHYLNRYRLISSLTNITIEGDEGADVILTCAEGIGFAFFNITSLQIRNLTIEGCGLVGNETLTEAFEVINKKIFLFYTVIHNTKVSILVADINGLLIEEVMVRNNVGIGLMGVNVMGNSTISAVTFANNTPSDCIVNLGRFENFPDLIGGGIFLLYADYFTSGNIANPTLIIQNSFFYDNQQCSLFPAIPIVSSTSPTVENLGFILGGGAGLGLVLSQLTFSVNMLVSSTVFRNNEGLYGTVYVAHFQGSSGSNVAFNNCVFQKNGFELSNVQVYRYSSGGAVTVILDIPYYQRNITINSALRANMIHFSNVDFLNNTAYVGGAIYMTALNSPLTTLDNQNQVIISQCRFKNNIATLAPVLSAFESKYNSLEPGVQLYIDSVNVEDNNGFHSVAGIHDSVIAITSLNVTVSGESTFTNNQGSSFILLTSTINFRNNITFKDNTASSGAALLIYTNSYIVFHDHTSVRFINNSATSVGGAIHVMSIGNDNSGSCLMWLESIDFYCNYYRFNCVSPATLNIEIDFEGNSAPLGNVIYGNVFTNCPWLEQLEQNSMYNQASARSGFDLLKSISDNENNNFTFNLNFSNDRTVNTNAFYLNVSSSEGSNTSNRIRLFPGQITTINISAQDAFLQDVPLAITSLANNQVMSQLGLSGYWFLSGDESQDFTQLSVFGQTNSNTTVSIYSVTSTASASLYIELQNCSYGFVFLDNSCTCDQSLLQEQSIDSSFLCNDTTGNITIPRFFWLGPSPADQYSFKECIMDYCQPVSITFNGEGGINNQCAYNRAGILCGQCAEGYSIVFGSNKCKQCKTNASVLGLIIGFLLMGVALVLIIAFLNFTVTEGYLNGIIFYANIINFFIPLLSQLIGSDAASIFLFISWINFDPGVNTCVYSGMNTLARTGLSLLFPGYLFLLMFIIIYLARRSARITNYGFSATRAFATLLLLCYSSVGKTCIEILTFVTINGRNGRYTGWRLDPNVEFGNRAHGFLVFVSVVLLLFYIIPFAVVLACPPWLIHKTKCGNNVALKFKPILDAFHHPFKDKFTFWIGFRCVIRFFPLILSGFFSYPDNAFGIAVFGMCFLFLHEMIHPFNSELQNKLETYFLINLLLIAIGILYYPQKLTYFFDDVSDFYIIAVVLFAYGGFVFVGILYLHIRFPKAFPALKLHAKKCCKCRNHKKRAFNEGKATDLSASEDSFNDIPKQVTVTELREPLLESGGSILFANL